MTEAAIKGHLDIVMFLHENRSEGCTMLGLELGRPHVLEFLKLHMPMKHPGHLAPLRSLMGRLF